ncbi:PREDICTED: aspartate aminotransferase, cytoplasmic-like isoform X2 [Priapulus caudatus]|uniref:Aspartate aminotransferase n=1 Tax=Priapulus caudatus TaxID=37621 RepID=A0ABM1EED5_PRICU|nr:PREDICTED: aspartate aminotransferase, cytoplasmic-like isoform X2 [Priapulus caudatus]
MTSRFGDIAHGPSVEVFELVAKFNEDTHPSKVNLSVGAYRTNEAKPWVLPVVRKVEASMAADETLTKEYLPITGMPQFCEAATSLVLGADNPAIAEKRAGGVQGIDATGCLWLAMKFLRELCGANTILASNPSWGNHLLMFRQLKYEDVREYRYWDASSKGLDLTGMLEDLKTAPDGSVVVLHACAHNPTGVDPTHEQWGQICDVMKAKKHYPLLDCAYQGFASGDLAMDAWAVRFFASQGLEIFAAQSFAKNFGLYNERVGNLTIVTATPDALERVKSQIKMIIRGMYSNPPAHGARIVNTTLRDPALFAEWQGCIKTMADRVLMMRAGLRKRLENLGTPGTWNHITDQIGMFSYTGLNPTQVAYLVKEYHVYVMKSGRINMCGLTTGNIDYVAKGIYDAIIKNPN